MVIFASFREYYHWSKKNSYFLWKFCKVILTKSNASYRRLCKPRVSRVVMIINFLYLTWQTTSVEHFSRYIWIIEYKTSQKASSKLVDEAFNAILCYPFTVIQSNALYCATRMSHSKGQRLVDYVENIFAKIVPHRHLLQVSWNDWLNEYCEVWSTSVGMGFLYFIV